MNREKAEAILFGLAKNQVNSKKKSIFLEKIKTYLI